MVTGQIKRINIKSNGKSTMTHTWCPYLYHESHKQFLPWPQLHGMLTQSQEYKWDILDAEVLSPVVVSSLTPSSNKPAQTPGSSVLHVGDRSTSQHLVCLCPASGSLEAFESENLQWRPTSLFFFCCIFLAHLFKSHKHDKEKYDLEIAVLNFSKLYPSQLITKLIWCLNRQQGICRCF